MLQTLKFKELSCFEKHYKSLRRGKPDTPSFEVVVYKDLYTFKWFMDSFLSLSKRT